MLIYIADAFDASLPEKLSVFGQVVTEEAQAKNAEVILIRSKTKATKEYIDAFPALKMIIRGGVGMDNIDRAYCQEKGIIATNTPKASSIAVAELAFSLMLSCPTNLCFYDSTMKKGEWQKKFKRTELYGKTLALLGYGNIARCVADRARAFGMKIQAYDKYVTSAENCDLKPSVIDAVKDADYISLHLPYTPETDKIINAETISKMEKKPVIINTGRGKCVDEAAVVEALKEGKLSWFCTDVYSSEPPVKGENPLLDAERVTLTPHVGANTNENLLRIGNEVITTIENALKEGKL